MAAYKVLVVMTVTTLCVVTEAFFKGIKISQEDELGYPSIANYQPAFEILTNAEFIGEYSKASVDRQSDSADASVQRRQEQGAPGDDVHEDAGNHPTRVGRSAPTDEQSLSVYDPRLPSLSLGLTDFYLPRKDFISENESQCLNDIKAFNDQFTIIGPGDTKLWTVRMMDSWGKIPDGFLFGNVHAVGMFEECVQLEAFVEGKEGGPLSPHYEDTTIKGRYCTIAYGPAEESNSSDISSRSGPALAVIANPLPFSYASCIPSSCSEEALLVSVEDKLSSAGRSLVSVRCQDRDQKLVLESADIAVLCVLALLLFVALAASITDVVIRGLEAKARFAQGFWGALLHFSLLRNLAATFRYDPFKPRSLNCLHMLRVVTLLWIIICHQYEATIAFTVNTFDAPKYQEPAFAQVITNGWPSVDTFFFVSGLLLGYRLVAGLRGTGGANAIRALGLALLRRIIRMLPTLLVLAVFAATVYGYLGSGPASHSLMTYSRNMCGQYWWRDVLFSNNFISWADNMEHAVEDCLDNTWYTAVDMQLMVALPLFVLPLAYSRKAGLVWLFVCTVGSLVVPMVITVVNDLPPGPVVDLSVNNIPKYYEYMRLLYFPPWSRATPWLVGILGGLLLHSHRWTMGSISKRFIALNYVIALAVGLAIVNGLFPYNVFPAKEVYPASVAVIYNTFSKLGWALALLWVVFSCFTGNAGMVGSVLHYPGWQPMSRLTFCMFLVAPLVQRWWLAMQYVPVYYSYLAKLFESCGVVFISGVVGLLLSVMVERPIRTLTDHFLLPAEQPTQKDGDSKEGRQVAMQALYAEL